MAAGLLSAGGYFVRTFIAFLVAPLLTAILPASYMAHGPNRTGLSAYIWVCCLIYLLQIVVGIPAFRLFSRTGRHRLWPYLLLGFLTSAVPVAVAVAIMRDSLSVLVFGAGYLGILGACTALIFWLVARPDKKSVTTKAQSSN
jgi:hypothetical protein